MSATPRERSRGLRRPHGALAGDRDRPGCGCRKIFADNKHGKDALRPELKAMLAWNPGGLAFCAGRLGPADTVCVARLRAVAGTAPDAPELTTSSANSC
jgi:hypothetical protein